MGQPIIRGIQAVGGVEIWYRYNNPAGLTLPGTIQLNADKAGGTSLAKTGSADGVSLAGFRLDSEFLRANPQIASSIVIPILGGGGVALTNNNRTGQLNLTCAKVSTPSSTTDAEGSMYTPGGTSAIGVVGDATVRDNQYDAVFVAQVQQSQEGGDSEGATICINFNFCGINTQIQFEGCTVATVDPIGLAGNDAANYNIVWNYLNWRVNYNAQASGESGQAVTSGHFIAA